MHQWGLVVVRARDAIEVADLSQLSQRLGRAIDLIRTWGAVAVIGAGASRAHGYPTALGLDPLVWHALDADPDARLEVGRLLDLPDGAAKTLVGHRLGSLRAAYSAIGHHGNARRVFQLGFAALDRERSAQPSPAHEALSELLHRGALELVISLNWDTALEAAFARRYGRRLSVGRDPIEKPHGDAASPEQDWVLPFEQPGLPQELLARVSELSRERPRVLLMIGYSEADADIVRQLIRPADERWEVIRISPSAHGEEDIPSAAEVALPYLLSHIYAGPETPGWAYVHFDRQRDLTAALLGERLGPEDVLACPRLPEVGDVVTRLRGTGRVVVLGPSGGGKSITGFQAARDLSSEGVEVLELADPSADPESIVASLASLRSPSILVVDDGQSVDRALLRRIEVATGGDLRLMVITTDRPANTMNVVEIAQQRAVLHLIRNLRSRSEEVRQILEYLFPAELRWDWELDYRLTQATDAATPWEALFDLRGGFGYSESIRAVLRASDRADLLLATLAIGQLISADAGIEQEELFRFGLLFNRGAEWVARSFVQLKARRLVLETPRLRTPHALCAHIAARAVSSEVAEGTPEAAGLAEVVRQCLLVRRGDAGFRGLGWLLTSLGEYLARVIDPSLASDLWRRCASATSSEDRSDAAATLLALSRQDLWDDSAWLPLWIQEVDAASAHGFADLLERMPEGATARVLASIDPIPVVNRMLSCSPGEAEACGRFLAVLARHSADVRRLFAQPQSIAAFKAAITRLAHTDIGAATWLTMELEEGNGDGSKPSQLAYSEHLAPLLARALSVDGLSAFADAETYLKYHLDIDELLEADDSQMRVAKLIANKVDAASLARSVSRSKRREWQHIHNAFDWFLEVDPAKARAVIRRLDIDLLGAPILDALAEPDEGLDDVLFFLSLRPDEQPARDFLDKNAGSIRRLTPTIAAIAPRPAAALITRNQPLALQARWQIWRAAWAVRELRGVSPQVAEKVIRSNLEDIAAGIASVSLTVLNGPSFAAAAFLLEQVRLVSGPLLEELAGRIASLDPITKWTAGMFGLDVVDANGVVRAEPAMWHTRGDRRDIRRLADVLSVGEPCGRTLAEQLTKRLDDLQSEYRRLDNIWRAKSGLPPGRRSSERHLLAEWRRLKDQEARKELRMLMLSQEGESPEPDPDESDDEDCEEEEDSDEDGYYEDDEPDMPYLVDLRFPSDGLLAAVSLLTRYGISHQVGEGLFANSVFLPEHLAANALDRLDAAGLKPRSVRVSNLVFPPVAGSILATARTHGIEATTALAGAAGWPGQ